MFGEGKEILYNIGQTRPVDFNIDPQPVDIGFDLQSEAPSFLIEHLARRFHAITLEAEPIGLNSPDWEKPISMRFTLTLGAVTTSGNRYHRGVGNGTALFKRRQRCDGAYHSLETQG